MTAPRLNTMLRGARSKRARRGRNGLPPMVVADASAQVLKTSVPSLGGSRACSGFEGQEQWSTQNQPTRVHTTVSCPSPTRQPAARAPL